jgi:hydrogenase maturation protease
MKRIAIVGIGNTLAGDDGVGIEIVGWLREKWSAHEAVVLDVLEGDLFAVAEWLPTAERFIFVDSVAGETPGENVVLRNCPRGFACSFHQSDIGAVMHTLKALDMVQPFPEWEIWGTTISLPDELRCGLSATVRSAALAMAEDLDRHLEAMLRSESRPSETIVGATSQV